MFPCFKAIKGTIVNFLAYSDLQMTPQVADCFCGLPFVKGIKLGRNLHKLIGPCRLREAMSNPSDWQLLEATWELAFFQSSQDSLTSNSRLPFARERQLLAVLGKTPTWYPWQLHLQTVLAYAHAQSTPTGTFLDLNWEILSYFITKT